MPISILMPALSPTMEVGKLAKWLVKEGDKVTSGDVLAEIETDKATMEVEAIDEGTVGKIVVAEGTDDVKVNAPIAFLLEEGEDASVLADVNTKAPTASAPPQTAEPSAPAAPDVVSVPSVQGGEATTRAPVQKQNGSGRIIASPLARRLAREDNIDLTAVTGTGPRGRIIKRDVETARQEDAVGAPAIQGAKTAPPLDTSGVYALYEADSYDTMPVDNIRRLIADRLTQSKRDIPHYYLTIDCRIDALLAARKRINDTFDEGKISVNDFVIKASAMALMKVPGVNASWAGDEILLHKHADISMAVAIDGGLITPIVRHADEKGLAEIAAQARDLATRARDRKLAPHEFQGGSFSISNLGMFGIKSFTAVINPPQAAILAVGGGEQRAVVGPDGEITAATVMSVTLSCDHRVVDGALGAQFLNHFKGFIEEPVRMLL